MSTKMERAIPIRAIPIIIIVANTSTFIRITTERRTSIRTIMMCAITITITTTTPTTSIRMPRKAGSGRMGRVRSFRLPLDLDAWLEDRIMHAQESVSDVFLKLLHGGLRLKPAYMIAHRNALIEIIAKNEREAYATYCAALSDTFEDGYLRHLEEWIRAEGFTPIN